MEIFRPDVKAGLFILVGGVLFLYALFRVGDLLDAFEDRRALEMRFTNAKQLGLGTEIYYRGMKIGKVTGIGVDEDGMHIRVIGEIEPETRLFAGTLARIDDKSLLGGKIIELIPPVEGPYDPIAEDAVLEGIPPADLAAFIQAVSEILPTLEQTLADLSSKVGRTLEELDKTLAATRKSLEVVEGLEPDLRDTLASFKTLAEHVDANFAEMTVELGESLDGIDPAVDEMKTEIVALTRQLRTDLKTTMTEMNALMADSGHLVRDADALLLNNSDELEGTLRALEVTMRNLEVLSETLADKPSALVWGRRKNRAAKRAAEEQANEEELRESGYIGRKPATDGGNL